MYELQCGVRTSAVAAQPCPSGHITQAIRLTSFAQIGSRRLRIARERYLQFLTYTYKYFLTLVLSKIFVLLKTFT